MPRWFARLAVLAALFMVLGSSAHAQSALPDFTGRRVVVFGTADTAFLELAPALEAAGKAGNRDYYLVVVDRTGDGVAAHHAYEDRLHDQWMAQAVRAGTTLDPDRTVLILLSLGDRQISVRPGFAVQRDLGLRGQIIDTELVQPYFVPAARAGDIKGGILRLVQELENWIARRQREIADAAAAAAREREERQARAQSSLVALRAAITRLHDLEQQRVREGFATGRAARTLADAEGALALADSALAGNPEGSCRTAEDALRNLGDLERTLQNLSRERDHLRAEVQQTAIRLRDLRGALEVARSQEMPDFGLPAELQRWEEELQRVREVGALDYAEAAARLARLQERVGGSEQALAQRKAAAREAERQRVFTHTVLPAGAAGLALLAIGGMVFHYRRRHFALRAEIERNLSVLNERIVTVMQRLDALKERLRLFLSTEAGGIERFEGLTRDVLSRVTQSLETTWKVWVAQNDRSSEARRLVLAEGWIGTRMLAQAAQRVREALEKDDPQVQTALADQEATLVQLEGARAETDRREAEAVHLRQEAAALAEQISAAGLSSVSITEILPRIDAGLAAAERREVRDPLGAGEDAARWVTQAREIRSLATLLLEDLAELGRLSTAIEETTRKVAAARAAGLRLCEETGNPDPMLALARIEVDETRQCLNAGDHAAAREQLRQGRELVDRAAHVLRAQEAARARVAVELPARRQESQRLHTLVSPAQTAAATLARDHRTDGWSAVAGCVRDSDILLSGFEARIAQAERVGDAQHQQYFQAANVLDAVAHDQQRVEQMLLAVPARLHELLECQVHWQHAAPALRARWLAVEQALAVEGARIQLPARERIAAAGHVLSAAWVEGTQAPVNWDRAWHLLGSATLAVQEAERVLQAEVAAHRSLESALGVARRELTETRRFLDAHHEDRRAANARQEEAVRVLAEVERSAVAGDVPWDRLEERSREAVTLSRRSRALAEQDMELARQAQAELEETSQCLRHAAGFLQHGVSVSLHGPERTLGVARQCWGDGEYERAIELANRAESDARGARRRAEAEVAAIEERIARQRREEEERREAERRRRETARAAQDASATSSCSSFGSRTPGRGSSGSSFTKW